MEGKFMDGENSAAKTVESTVFIVGLIATTVISFNTSSIYTSLIFTIFGMIVTVFLTVEVTNQIAKGKFSADEKSVVFSVGFRKYEYSYKDIINVRTEITFTDSRYGKIPHIELVLSLRDGKTVRFSDDVPSYECDTLKSLKKFQDRHEFTKLAGYIKKINSN